MSKRVATVVAVLAACFAGSLLAAPPVQAATYTFSTCTTSGTGTPPAGLDQLTVDVTGTAPAQVDQDDSIQITGVTVTITNPHSYPINTSGTSMGANIPTGSGALTRGFPSPLGFSIPAGGSAQFTGSLEYVATLGPSVLEFRPETLVFRFGNALDVVCTVAAGGAPFATTIVLDAPGYEFLCDVPFLGATFQQTIDVVGTAPDTVQQGAAFSLTDVVTTSTSPVSVTVLSTTFTLATPGDVNATSPLSITMPGPITLPAGVPFNSPPMAFDFVASGAAGSVVAFRPATITTVTQEFGTITCNLLPGQPPLATTEITAAALDQVGVAVLGPGGLIYGQLTTLTAGDFDVTYTATGRVRSVVGQGTFAGPSGGVSELAVRYHKPTTSLRLKDPATGLDLRATSFLPPTKLPHSDVVLGVAFARLDNKPVVVIWAVRDVA